MGLVKYMYYVSVKGIRQERILYYIPYDEIRIMDLITHELNWSTAVSITNQNILPSFNPYYLQENLI